VGLYDFASRHAALKSTVPRVSIVSSPWLRGHGDIVEDADTILFTPNTIQATTTTFHSIRHPGLPWRHIDLPGRSISLSWTNESTRALYLIYSSTLANNTQWAYSTPDAINTTIDRPIATTPEPATAQLAVIGAVAFLAYGWSRHRRHQGRQAAA
jgi:hypothetical protein